MSDQERKAYEAFIAAAKAHGEGVTPLTSTEAIEDLRITLFARLIEWHDTGAWLPTEQHETVTAILKDLDCGNTITTSGFNHRSWIIAGKPGLPKPPPKSGGQSSSAWRDGCRWIRKNKSGCSTTMANGS